MRLNAQGAVTAPALLTDLLDAVGPSGREELPARVWRDAASAFATVTSDTLGTSFARVAARDGAGAPTLAFVGHIDEIGLAITHVDDNGYLAVTTVGGIPPETLVGQRVTFLTRNGEVTGTVGRQRVAAARMQDRPRVEHADLHVDIGARDRAEAEQLVQVGDSGVWTGPPVELPGGRLLSRALDNRLGSYIALEAARRVAEGGGAAVDVVAVAAVQEEVGLYGARAAAFELDPLAAIVVDVTPATDYPGGDPRQQGRIEVGRGTMIARGPTLNAPLSDLIARAAEEDGIPHALEVYSRTTRTDADEFHRARAGVPTGLLSIPTRYVHTPNELCDLEDVESAVRVLVAVAARVDRGTSFVR